MNGDNNEKVEQIEDLSDLEEAERIEINISSPSTEPTRIFHDFRLHIWPVALFSSLKVKVINVKDVVLPIITLIRKFLFSNGFKIMNSGVVQIYDS